MTIPDFQLHLIEAIAAGTAFLGSVIKIIHWFCVRRRRRWRRMIQREVRDILEHDGICRR
jgi:hypothetical protein